MTLFVSSKPVTTQAQTCLDQLRQILTQCQLNDLQIHIAYLYNNSTKTPILVMDGIEIKDDEKQQQQ